MKAKRGASIQLTIPADGSMWRWGGTIHPHWWKEIKTSGRVSMGSHIVREGLSATSEALHYGPNDMWQHSGCQLAPSMRPWGGGMPHPSSAGLGPADFKLYTATSSPKEFPGCEAGEDPGLSLGATGLH